jgi:hypothetical protein
MDSFPDEVNERLKWYVYRLIDPRNGETFYVGKGKGDRIFQHAKGELAATPDEPTIDLRRQRIRTIRDSGLAVAHVIHRHGIEFEEVALEVEAALIDAYPGLANKVAGHGSDDRGVRHVEEIVAEFKAKPFEVQEPLILISIGQSFDAEPRGAESGRIYDAVRGCWKLSEERVKKFRLVLAHRHGLVVGAFRPQKWMKATPENFRWLPEPLDGRIGFEGVEAEEEVRKLYSKKRVPDKYRAKGAANPVRFIEPTA